jgi:hypothetical protein
METECISGVAASPSKPSAQATAPGETHQFLTARAASLLCALSLVAPLTAAGASGGRFVQDRFAIGMWVAPLIQTNLEARYREITNANFNLVIGSWNTSPTQQLAICERVGLKCLPTAQGPAASLPDSSAAWGYFVTDEPATSEFTNLAARVQEIRTQRPGLLAYINLFPNYASAAQLGAASYQQYVDQFMQVVQPDVLSMDHYPLMRPEADSREAYCANLETMRVASQSAGIPFWNYFYSMPFNDRLDPTEAQIRWQIYASVAYGAKGVLYYCYWTPGQGAAGTGEFPKGGAIITADGLRTRHYEEARRINAELRQLGPTLMKLASTGVWRADTATNPLPPSGCGLKSLTRVAGDPESQYIVGTYRHEDGRRALLILNHNYAYTAWPTLEFDVPSSEVLENNKADGSLAAAVDDSPELPGFQLSIGPGDARLFILPAHAATNAFVSISSVEQWDGIQNPHAAEGITLSGSGTDADPAVYTIPADLVVASSGGITLSARPPTGGQDLPPDNSITFKFVGGNLQIASGGFINVARRTRDGVKHILLSMGGGDILGAGRIDGLWDSLSTPRVLSITDARNVTLTSIDLHVENVNNRGRHLSILASGRVTIASIDNSDRDPGGNDAGDVIINGAAIRAGSIDVTAARTDSGVKNGTIRLTALGPPTYDLNAALENTAQNQLVLTGLVSTAGAPATLPGNVTLTGVVIELQPGFQMRMAQGATLTLSAGMYPNGVGAKPTDLFIDQAGTQLAPSYVVQWSGALSPALNISLNGSSIALQWTWDGYVLQENTVLTNPFSWVNVSSNSPLIREIDAEHKFYRLKR